MKVFVFMDNLGIGGTEKAACRWAWGLKDRGHQVSMMTLCDGPRRTELESHGISVEVIPPDASVLAQALMASKPDAIHAHVPGRPHRGDILGEALQICGKIPVVQTNVFGVLLNPREDAWTDYRLFISWTSCVQAARRSFRKLDLEFFRKASVAVYPLDPDDGPSLDEIAAFRQSHGVGPDEILFGRLSRPEPNKWTDLPLDAFRLALAKKPALKFLLREPPPLVVQALRSAPDRDRFVILSATSDPRELRLTLASLDAVLHTSSIGESFGYGIAEPMNYGKPVIANSVPWGDQAQIELVRHGECGFLASTPQTMSEAILKIAGNKELRTALGNRARQHIRVLSSVQTSLDRLEGALCAAVNRTSNPQAESDLKQATQAAAELDKRQLGDGWKEQLSLRPFHYRVRFSQWRRALKARLFPSM